jgi:hypothetical protein
VGRRSYVIGKSLPDGKRPPGVDGKDAPHTPTYKTMEKLCDVNAMAGLCDELGLERQGTQSPPSELLLPLADRKALNIPPSAAHFTFMYPLTPKTTPSRGMRAPTVRELAGARAEKVDAFLSETCRHGSAGASYASVCACLPFSWLRRLARAIGKESARTVRATAGALPLPLSVKMGPSLTLDEAAVRRRHSWGSLFLLGGFAYYDESGNLVRILPVCAGRSDFEAVPLTLDGPFAASEEAARALWDQGRMNKVSLPALLLESAHNFAWVGTCAEGDGEMAEHSVVDGGPPRRAGHGELLISSEDGEKRLPLSEHHSYPHGALVYHGGDPHCVRDKGERHIFFRVIPSRKWHHQLLHHLIPRTATSTKSCATDSPPLTQHIDDEPASPGAAEILSVTPSVSERRTDVSVASVDKRGSQVGGEMSESSETRRKEHVSDRHKEGSETPRRRKANKARLRAIRRVVRGLQVASRLEDIGGRLEESALFFWFECLGDGWDADRDEWRRCDEASNAALREMVQQRETSCSWSSSGWHYHARCTAEGGIWQRNILSERERRVLLRLEYDDGEPCGAAYDERYTRAVVLHNGEWPSSRADGGGADGGVGAPSAAPRHVRPFGMLKRAELESERQRRENQLRNELQAQAVIAAFKSERKVISDRVKQQLVGWGSAARRLHAEHSATLVGEPNTLVADHV